MPRAPIALFTYNRPWHTRQLLESLCANEGARESELFIFCDGPKSLKDVEAVGAVRDLVKSRNWCGKVNVVEQIHNLGLANSIIKGVTEIVNRYGKIIILEDDLVLSPQFLNYMNDALEIYKDVSKVMHISAYMFPLKEEFPETFFYRGTTCWGWGTWKGSWDKFDSDGKRLAEEFKSKNSKFEFDIQGGNAFYKMLKKQIAGSVDSWAIRWYASVFLDRGLCLHPGRSLVKNIGHDMSGVHCDLTDVFDVEVSNVRVKIVIENIVENPKIVDAMMHYYRSIKDPLYIHILNKMRKMLNL